VEPIYLQIPLTSYRCTSSEPPLYKSVGPGQHTREPVSRLPWTMALDTPTFLLIVLGLVLTVLLVVFLGLLYFAISRTPRAKFDEERNFIPLQGNFSRSIHLSRPNALTREKEPVRQAPTARSSKISIPWRTMERVSTTKAATSDQ
jgi:cbb3-type cytochrome oxidase subunit 3